RIAAASARRSVPVGWSARVMIASKPASRAAPAMRSSSVATATRCAPAARARSATRTTIGLPPMSASALPGRRVEAIRAGTRATKAGPAGGRAAVSGAMAGVDAACLVGQHDGNVVADRVGEAIAGADQFRLDRRRARRVATQLQRALAERAHEDVKQSLVHEIGRAHV